MTTGIASTTTTARSKLASGRLGLIPVALVAWAGMLSLMSPDSNGSVVEGERLPSQSATRSDPLLDALGKVVKITGAGGYLGLEPFQTGIAIGREGWVLTCWSHVLLEPDVTVTLPNGRRLPAEVAAVEPELELALLKVDAELSAWFDLSAPAAETSPGQWVYALHNAFGIAVGHEPVSVQRGVLAGRGILPGKRGLAGRASEREGLLLDFVTSTPGTAGGAIVDLEGNLLGIIGKPVQHQQTRVWTHYALPIENVAAWAKSAMESFGSPGLRTDGLLTAGNEVPTGRKAPQVLITPERLGFTLVPELVPTMPAFVDAVGPGSWAAQVGLRPDDLIVTVNGQIVRTCGELRRALGNLSGGQQVRFGIQRGEEFRELEGKVPND